MSSAVARSRSAAWTASLRLASGRLLSRGLARLVLLLLAACTLVALVERDREPLSAPGRSLFVVTSLLVPLLCFAVVSLATTGDRLDVATWPLARHGVPRRSVALALLAMSGTLAAALSVAAVVVAMTLSYPRAPGLLGDVITSSGIAALGAVAYVALFTLGAGFLRLGRGRWIALGFDFLLTTGSGAIAAIGPRAHIRSLVGGAPVLDWSQRDSSVILAALAVAFCLLAAMRAGD
jgi:hypothetical protein